MDLSQRKLTKAEWTNTEIPVSDSEKQILQLIVDGYSNVNLRRNNTQSILSSMKIDYSENMEMQLYKQYFEKDVNEMTSKYFPEETVETEHNKKKHGKQHMLKARDLIRIKSMDSKVDHNPKSIFEYMLIDFCRNILKSLHDGTNKYAFYLYTLIQFQKSSISQLNAHVMLFVNKVIDRAKGEMQIFDILRQSHAFIEKNPYLLKFEDMTLFNHQKELFSIFRKDPATAKLVLYIAPTGTGKTLSPIGLASAHRVIFVCGARHVGLALAKSAISVGKRIAFAFGCETASDIRLHYFAASVYTRNKRTGGIGKVDNSAGDKVEIIICDVQSYLTAMYYMLAFSPATDHYTGEPIAPDADIITYWDEPTITMDYENHPLHSAIHRNWVENKISKMVLSCATLPTEEEIVDTISDFRAKFGGEMHSIISYDCKKSISVLNKTGFSVLPHLLFRDPNDLAKCAKHCEDNKTLLRYFDLSEIVRFIELVHNRENCINNPAYMADVYFEGGIMDITMNNIKLYYLKLLGRIEPDQWPEIFDILTQSQSPKFDNKIISKTKSMPSAYTQTSTTTPTNIFINNNLASQPLSRTQSIANVHTPTPKLTAGPSAGAGASPSAGPSTGAGILLTTKDAHTLTDGPTIFLTEDVEKVGRFYVQQTNIPTKVFESVINKIANNSAIQQKMNIFEKSLEDATSGDSEKEKKNDKQLEKETLSPEIKTLIAQIDGLRNQIKTIVLDSAYIPNTVQHQSIWVDKPVPNAFISCVDEESIRGIMATDVNDQMKLLLLLGIGMFVEKPNPQYMEIMKQLANDQKLFLILASSDYVYGTNYQFCHGFIGKDLTHMTQQKTIQAMGRIGRNQMQQEYTIRFRDDDILSQLFQKSERNMEAEVMNRLFCS